MTSSAKRVALRARLAHVARKTGIRSTPTPAPFDTDPFTQPIPPIAATDPPGPTVVLFNDSRDQINFGAVALVDGLIRIVQRSMPDATLVPIPSHWLVEQSVWRGYIDGGKGMRQPRATFPRIADEFESVADEWMDGRGGPDAHEYLVRFEAADAIVLNGEGSIYRTNQSAVRELFLAWLAKQRLGKTTLYVNGGIHLTGVTPLLNPMVRKTFPVLDAVAIREAPSLRNLAEFAPEVNAQIFPDSAFVFTPDDALHSPAVAAVEERIGGRPFFCFDPGGMPVDVHGGSASALSQLISRLASDGSLPVFVSTGPWDDYIADAAAHCGALFIDSITDYREFMSLVRNAEYLVSGRYHNVILAAIMGTPSIALGSTTHKVHGACEMLEGAVGTPYDGTSMRPDLDEIVARAGSYRVGRTEWTTRLQEICARRRDEVGELGALIDRFARHPVTQVDGPGPARGLLVGYGSIGRRHLGNLYALGVTDWAVVHSGRGTLPMEPPCPVRVHSSLTEALETERPTFAVVANPTALHATTALECIRHHCDVLVEKPVSHRSEGLAELAETAAVHDVRVLVGFQFRFDPGLRRVRELIDTGALGDPIHARVVWGEYLPDWHPWEDWRASYAARRDLGGGVHHTLSHPLDYLRMLLGEPTTVAATLVDHGPLGLDVAEAAEITLRFGSGPYAQVHLDYWQRPPTHRLDVVCADGTITWDHHQGRLHIVDGRTSTERVEPCPGIAERDELFRAEARHFLDVVARRAEPACSLHDGIRAVALCEAVERAAATTATPIPEAP